MTSVPKSACLPTVWFTKCLIMMLFVLVHTKVSAQECVPIFKKTFGGNGNDEASDILYCGDGGSVIVGQTTSNTSGDYDALVMKLNAAGTIEWSRQTGGTSDDYFTRIKPLASGGYILIGNTKSYGNANGEVMLVKLDAAGMLLWARHYGNTGVKTTGKEIIELQDGSYVFVANENDSTDQSNGIIAKIDAAGNMLWTKSFDNGNNDGLAYVMEDGPNLYVPGHAGLATKDGIVMQLRKTDGNVVSVKKFHNDFNNDENVLNIYKIPNGVAFGVHSVTPSNNSYSRLALFKMRNDGSVYYIRETNVTTGAGVKIKSVKLITSVDSGFVYIIQDTTPLGNSKVVFIGPTANSEWGQDLYSSWGQAGLFQGLDRNGTNGYLYSGFTRVWENTAFKNKIVVYKTDRNGSVKPCTQGWLGAFVDTVHYTIQDFTWSNITSANLSVNNPISLTLSNTNFTTTVNCNQVSCTGAAAISATCSSSFLSTYKSTRSYQVKDVAGTADGGSVMVGMQHSFLSAEGFVTRLKPNGDVLWSKTYNTHAHTAFFKKVLNTPDNNLLILGVDEYELNHSVSDSTFLMKIDANTGAIIWARYFLGEGYDICPSGDGGYVISVTRNWGFPPLYSFVIKIDELGNVQWQKQIHHSLSGASYRGVTVSGSSIYMAADDYSQSGVLKVLKLNLNTGNSIWSKKFTVPGNNFVVQGIQSIADSIFIALDFIGNASSVSPGMFCMDANGNVLRIFKFTEPVFSALSYNGSFNSHRVYDILKTSDNNFVVANQTVQSADSSFSVLKFNGSGQAIWSRRYPNLKKHSGAGIAEVGGSIFISGNNYLGVVENSLHYQSFLLKTESDGRILNGLAGDCFSEAVTTSYIALTAEAVQNDFDSVGRFTEIPTLFTPHVRTIITWPEISCNNNITSCNSVSVQGAARVCNVSDTFNYRAVRAAGCVSPVNWQVDPADATIISSTDTSVRIHFSGTGSNRVIAVLNAGCAIIKDTLLVTIYKNATTLTLGPDSSICENNSLVLRANKGFERYVWQDGSTADTLSINSPGLYHILITDSCGNQARDSVRISARPPAYINAGPDRIRCNNDTVYIVAEPGLLNYQWTPNYNVSSVASAAVAVWPSVDTTYILKAEKTPGCFAFDTVRIMLRQSPAIRLGNDTSFCRDASIVLNAGPGFTTYNWSTGENSMQIQAGAVGGYSVLATDPAGCISKDTLNIVELYSLPTVQLDAKDYLCVGVSRILDAGSFASYLWQDGSLARTFTAKNTGTYHVAVLNNVGCKGFDTIRINKIIPLQHNFLPADTSVCFFEPERLQPKATFKNYLWSNGSNASSILLTQPGKYWLQVTDNYGCNSKDTVEVNLKECMKGLYVPSAFTPNNDSKNDYLKAMLFGSIQSFVFTVYNRYGTPIFKTNDSSKGWDGKISGVAQEMGNYVWVCEYQLLGQSKKIEKGYAVLIR